MAVAFDNVSAAAGATTTTSPLTFSHTVNAGQSVLLAGIAVDTSNDSGMTCTCTYGGSPMTSLGVVHSGAITSGFLQVFIIESPAGTANVVATVTGGTPAHISGGSISLVGVAAPIGSAWGNEGTGTGVAATISTAVTPGATTSGNIVVGFTCSGTSIASATAPSTSRFIKSQVGAGAAASVAGATSPATGSAVTMAWAMGSDDYAEIVVEVLAAPPAGGPIRLSQQLGNRQRKRRKNSQVPQFNAPPPGVTIIPTPLACTASFPAETVIPQFPCITGTAGAGTGYFVDQVGTPRLVWGDAAWALCGNVGRWSSGAWQSDYDTYLTTRAGQGVNVIYTKPMGTAQSGNIDSNGGTFDSLFPFQGGTPSTGVAAANPSTGLTATYWARIDYFLASAQAKGITVFLNAIGYNSDFNGGPGPLAGKSAAEFQAYGAALGNRYKSQVNLVWMVADDYFGGDDTVIAAFLTGLQSVGDSHVISIENIPESTSRLTVDGAGTHMTWGFSNADFNFVYSYNVIYYGTELAYTVDGTLPVIAGDGYFYQGNSTYSGGTGAFAFDRAVRQDAWHALSSGARGKITGDEAIWQWASTAQAAAANNWWWKNNAKNIRTAIEGMTDWQKLVPDTTSALVTAGRGTHASAFSSGGGGGQYEVAFTDSYVSASMTPGGTLALVYLSHGTTITVNTALLATGWAATWVDPVTGATSSAGAGPTFNSTAKGSNSQGDPDWALVFQVGGGVSPTAGLAAGTGTALQPSVRVDDTGLAGLAVATGTALAPSVQVDDTGLAGLANAIGTALTPSVRVDDTGLAGLAAGTGTAYQPSVTTTGDANVSAGLAGGTGTAYQPFISYTAGVAAAIGTALAPSARVDDTGPAGLATGTGTAFAPSVRVDATASAGLATGTGTALAPSVRIDGTVTTGLATGTGTAYQPSVSTSGNTTAAAGLATATGTALAPSVRVDDAVGAGAAAGTGTAFAPSIRVDDTVAAGLAAGTGTALAPSVRIDGTVTAGLAAGTGTAYQPSVSTSGNANAAAGLATATGTALQPTVATTITAPAGLATGTGTALQPTVATATTAPAGLATGTSTASQPSVSITGNVTANAGLAVGTGTAYQPSVSASVTANAGLATGTGTALNIAGGRTPGVASATGSTSALSLSRIANAQAATALAIALQPQATSAAAVVKGSSTGTSVTKKAGTVATVSEAAGTSATVTSPGSSTGGVT